MNDEILLKDYLDKIGVKESDDRIFILFKSLFSTTRMEVSRRYLESEPFKYLLDKTIYCVGTDYDIYGYKTLKIILK